MTVSITSLSKHFGGICALDDLSIQFKPNAITVLLGASGCGKTTTLRCIAGLEQPSSGEIEIDGHIVYSSQRHIDLPPEKRKLGMVFQSYAIWPHLSVRENVALPLRARGTSAQEVSDRVLETLKAVGLGAHIERSATQLSGGQQQRVSIARCLVADPSLILMDEPLSNLDAKLRVEMRQEIRSLQRRLGATILFVTHDQEEAMSLGDEIFLFDKGRVVQRGAPEELYFRPTARYVAEFLGKANLFKVAIQQRSGAEHIRQLVSSSGQIIVEDNKSTNAFNGVNDHDRHGSGAEEWRGNANANANGNVSGNNPPNISATIRATQGADASSIESGAREAVCMIRPEAWRVGPWAPPGKDVCGVPGRVRSTSFVGDRRELHVETSFGDQLVVTPGFQRYAEGDQITLSVAPENLHLMRAQ